jgi:hypothetical protein
MSNFFSTLVEDIKTFFGSSVGLTITEFTASGAGIASALAIIEEANPSDKTGTANDVYLLASASYSLLSGTSTPTLAQIQGAFTAFKSSASTSGYAQLATTFSAALYNYISKYSGTPWVQVATWYVYGWQLGAQVFGGAATASASVPSTPVTPPSTTAAFIPAPTAQAQVNASIPAGATS